MNSEHAETYLRLLAESELRRAGASWARRADAAQDADAAGAAADCHVRAHDVAWAFAEIGALDRELTESIVAELDVALAARSPGRAAPARPLLGGPAAFFAARRGAMAPRAAMASVPRPAIGPVTIAPCGQVLRLDDTDLYVLAVVRTPARTWLSLAARSRHGQPARAGRPGFPRSLTATDAAGTAYSLRFSGGGGDDWFHGQSELTPSPPPGTEWLDIDGGGPPVRIDFTARPPQARVAVTPVTGCPGEAFLQAQAEALLARGRPPGAGELARLAAVVPALTVVGALPAGTVAEGRLRWLCERFGVTGHGLTAPTAELPEHWAGLLAGWDRHGERGGAGPVPDDDRADGPVAIADLVVVLPEIDGRQIALAGLITAGERTSMHGVFYSTGAGDDDPHYLPACLLRDDSGQWHTTWRRSGGGQLYGMHRFTAEVLPPLRPPASTAEVLITGRSAAVGARIPLTWGTDG